jgi:hypothetical protein
MSDANSPEYVGRRQQIFAAMGMFARREMVGESAPREVDQ